MLSMETDGFKSVEERIVALKEVKTVLLFILYYPWHCMKNRWGLDSIPCITIYKWAASWQNQQCGCAPSEDSDQPGHPPSLIRVFAVRMKNAWVLSLATHWVHSEDSDQTGRMPRLIWVVAGRTLTLLVLSRGGSNHIRYINHNRFVLSLSLSLSLSHAA